MLRTDASGTGIGAVLLQKNNADEWVPVQWSSKKLTDTEMRYGMPKKEMLAIFWAVKKFEYELRGRRFRLVTDHKALSEIRNKSEFNNARINKWIEQIKEFDFEVEYNKKVELAVPDALSRLYEKDEEKEKKRKERAERISKGKWNKHVMVEEGKEMLQFDDRRKAIIPEIKERLKLVVETHERLEHRAADAVYYEMKKEYYWPGMKEISTNVTSKCEKCLVYNRKKKAGFKFVATSRIQEMVALDLMDLRAEGKYVLVAIDYYSRAALTEVVGDKRTETVLKMLEKWIKKNGQGNLENNVKEITSKYNKTYHASIRCTPIEAWAEDTERLMIGNGEGKKYKPRKRDKFKVNEKVLVAQHENLNMPKEFKGRFMKKGLIMEVMKNDSYSVRMKDN